MPILVAALENGSDRRWDTKVKLVDRNINNNINKTIGLTPFEVLYGFKPINFDGELQLKSYSG